MPATTTTKGWLMEGTVGKTHDDSVWLKRHGTFDPFGWGGTCMALDEGTEPLGELTATTRRSVHGGLQVDGVLTGAPEIASTTLSMKKLHYDMKKVDLKKCMWDVDQRTTCGGMGEDAWNKWIEILRYCYGKATERGTPPVTYEGESEEQVVKFPWQALYINDIRRVVGEIGEPLSDMTAPLAIMFTDVTSCQPGRCPGVCDDQEDCIVVGVTETVALGACYLVINLNGGDLDAWIDAPTVLTGFGTNDAGAIACAGEFLVTVCNAANLIIYSDDLGAIQTSVALTAPNNVDMIDQSFIVVVADTGVVYGSYDAARTWRTLDAGYATVDNLTEVMIARDNPQVIYAASSVDDTIIKSENGGKTWFSLGAAPTGTAGGISSLHVVNQNHILVGTTVGEVFESSDGGGLWTEQLELPGLTVKANITIEDITGCGCGDLGLVVSEATGVESFFYRNVDGGANGRWFQPEEVETVTATYALVALTCCGSSHFIAVGGLTVTADQVLLLV